MNDSAGLMISPRVRTTAWLLVALGGALVVCGLRFWPDRTWPNLLLNGFYVTSAAASALLFLSIERLTGARWSASLRRIPEAFLPAMPVAAVLLLLVGLGREAVFPWLRPGALEPEYAGRVVYLRPYLIFPRMAVVLGSWVLFAWLFRRGSLEQERQPDRSLLWHHRLNRYAAAFAVLFAITFTVCAYDWIAALEPSWSSTMFGVYLLAGTFVQGLAAITLATAWLSRRGELRTVVRPDQLHDLGKLLFAFSTFWAYIWTCQYLLIWYANIPDEVTHYWKRTAAGWLSLFALNLILNWVVPFLVLLSARSKRNPRVLAVVAVTILCGRWLDLYLLIMPESWSTPRLGVFEVATAAGYTALIFVIVVRSLARAPLVPRNDPIVAAEELYEMEMQP